MKNYAPKLLLLLSFLLTFNGFSQCGPGEVPYQIFFSSDGSFPNERSWEIVPASGGDPVISAGCNEFGNGLYDFCLIEGESYVFNAFDDYGDGWGFYGSSPGSQVDAWVIQWLGGYEAFSGGSPDNGVNGDNTDDCIGLQLEYSLTFTATQPANCQAPDLLFLQNPSCAFSNADLSIRVAEEGIPSGGLIELNAFFEGDTVASLIFPNALDTARQIGNFPFGAEVIFDYNIIGLDCPITENIGPLDFSCPWLLPPCGDTLFDTHCYSDLDETFFLYQSPGGLPVTLAFEEGLIEECCDEILIYSGGSNGELLYQGNNGGDLSGLSVIATSGVLYMEFDTDFSVNCAGGSAGTSTWNWNVTCGDAEVEGCTDPEALNFSANATTDDGSCFYSIINDTPCGALDLICGAPAITGDFNLTTLDTALVPLSCSSTLILPVVGDVWFKFEADGNSLYEITETNSLGMVTALFSGDDCNALIPYEGCSTDQSIRRALPAGTYYLMIRPIFDFDDSNSFELSLDCSEAVENDQPCGAFELVCNGPQITGSFENTSFDPSLVAPFCLSSFDSEGGDIWYTFEADGTSFYEVTKLSGASIGIGLYSGTTCDELTLYQPCSSSASIGGVLPAGTYYLTARPLNSFGVSQTFQVVLNCIDGAAPNDEPCGAFPLSCNGDTLSGSFLASTQTVENPCSSSDLGDVWYTFEADGQTGYLISSGSQQLPISASLYRADQCDGALELIQPCASANELAGTYEEGTYYVRLRDRGTDNTHFIALTCVENQENENPCSALPIDCAIGSIQGTTIGAAQNTVCPGNGQSQSAGVWYIYDSQIDGTLRLNSCQNGEAETSFNSDISVFKGECDALECVPISSADVLDCGGRADVTFTTLTGESYYILVNGRFNAQGSFDIELTCTEEAFDCFALGNFGEACDDNDPLTFDEIITESCNCEGLPIIPGQICELPLMIQDIPFSMTDTTSNYFNDYNQNDIPPYAPDVEVEISASNYLRGPDVVYAFAPAMDVTVDISLSDHSTRAGIYVFTGCPFQSMIGSNVGIQSNGRLIPDLHLNGGETYYIVISSSKTFKSIAYTLTISESVDCPLLGNFGDPCDDGNPDTFNDLVGTDCSCEGTDTCTSPYPAVEEESLTTIQAGNVIATGWNPVPLQIGCQIQVKLEEGALLGSRTLGGANANGFNIPLSLLTPNTDYAWRVRCGCSEVPLIAGPFSSWQSFSTPAGAGITSNPSPTTGLSNVTFRLSKEAPSTLEVFDLNGRSIQVLYDGLAESNMDYRFTFDGSALPNGIYIYRLSTAKQVVNEKFVIAR